MERVSDDRDKSDNDESEWVIIAGEFRKLNRDAAWVSRQSSIRTGTALTARHASSMQDDVLTLLRLIVKRALPILFKSMVDTDDERWEEMVSMPLFELESERSEKKTRQIWERDEQEK